MDGDAQGEAADVREGAPGGRQRPVKVISKGKASLVISGAEDVPKEAPLPKQLVPEPRLVSPEKPAQPEKHLHEKEPEPEFISRLESKVNPGKERIKVDKAKFEKLQQRPDEAEVREEEWGKAISPGWWVALGGLAAIVLLLAALAIESLIDGDEAEVVQPAAYAEPEPDPYEGSPEKWFRDRAGRIAEQARVVMDGYVHAQTTSERSQYVRFPETYRQRVKDWHVPVSPRYQNTSEYKINVRHTGDTAFLAVDCRGEDFLPFRGYFVHEGDSLKLDWEATVAWSEVSLAKMKSGIREHQRAVHELEQKHRRATEAYREATARRAKALEALEEQRLRREKAAEPKIHIVSRGENMDVIARRYGITLAELMEANKMTSDLLQIGQSLTIPNPGGAVSEPDVVVPPAPAEVPPLVLPAPLYSEPLLVRCMISRKDEFYAGPYNDEDYSAYMLTAPNGVGYMWAYTDRDSELDLELRRMLDHGRFVVDLKKNLRVTVRVVREKKDALPSQLKFVELVHPEWVTP